MIEVLKNKNQTTRFQILVEIADSGTVIQQRDIAKKLGITPQAVSDYIAQLIREKMLISEGHSSYRITNEGVNWIIRMLRELSGYTDFIQMAVTNISICTAIAESDLQKDQKVGLKMKGGLLYATQNSSRQATGVAVSSAAAGEDIGITNIEGIVPLRIGRVTILRIPGIQNGGSGKSDLARLKSLARKNRFTVSLGLEAFVVLKKAGVEFCRYGATEAAVEAAKSGLSPLAVCAENETAGLISRLDKERIAYEIIDAIIPRR
jgi:putative transcriptional regulator